VIEEVLIHMAAKSIIEEYLNEVKENIYRPEKTDRFIDEIRSSLTDYVENNPDCDFEDLVNQFGSPEDVAREYLDSYAYSSPKEISKKNRRRRILIIILIVLLAALIAYCIDISKQTQGKATDVVTIYEEVPVDNN
jgi:uncharacterized membrane protein